MADDQSDPVANWVWVSEEEDERRPKSAEVRIIQVENPDYTHWMVKHSGLGITHSGVLIETRSGYECSRIQQAIVDLIVIEDVPYIAIRHYCATRRRWTLDTEKKWIHYFCRHRFDGGRKPWKFTTKEGTNKPDVLVVAKGAWISAQSVSTHMEWVEKVAHTMQSRVKDGFHILKRNCQHVAAWTMNTVNVEESGSKDIDFVAAPPNKIFRIISTDWLPDECNLSLSISLSDKVAKSDSKQNQNEEKTKEMSERKSNLEALIENTIQFIPKIPDIWNTVQTPGKEIDENMILSAEERGWTVLTSKQKNRLEIHL